MRGQLFRLAKSYYRETTNRTTRRKHAKNKQGHKRVMEAIC